MIPPGGGIALPLAVTFTIQAESQLQVDAIYRELTAHPKSGSAGTVSPARIRVSTSRSRMTGACLRSVYPPR